MDYYSYNRAKQIRFNYSSTNYSTAAVYKVLNASPNIEMHEASSNFYHIVLYDSSVSDSDANHIFSSISLNPQRTGCYISLGVSFYPEHGLNRTVFFGNDYDIWENDAYAQYSIDRQMIKSYIKVLSDVLNDTLGILPSSEKIWGGPTWSEFSCFTYEIYGTIGVIFIIIICPTSFKKSVRPVTSKEDENGWFFTKVK